jgi:iron complex outermembrane receptor protein
VPTYAFGAQLSPIRDITLRGQYQRAVRAPNVGELFGGQGVGFPPATDPCALPSAATNPTIRALCEATGVPAANVGQAFIQPNTQIEGVFGGNPNLQEEVGDTWTAGVVLQPSFIPRLNVAVDWYNIQVDNLIAAAGGGVSNILNLCYNVIQDASHPTCQAVLRDPAGSISGGGIFVVEALNANLAAFETEGVDLAIDYNMPMNFGLLSPESRLTFFFLGNYTRTNDFTPVVGVDDVIECAGAFGLNCGNPTPKYKFTTRVAWTDGPLTSTLRWRHVGSTVDDDEETDFIVDELDDYNVFDLAFSVAPTDTYTINFGINNLFDKKPPIIGSNQTEANTYPEVFDVLGRDFFVSVNLAL